MENGGKNWGGRGMIMTQNRLIEKSESEIEYYPVYSLEWIFFDIEHNFEAERERRIKGWLRCEIVMKLLFFCFYRGKWRNNRITIVRFLFEMFCFLFITFVLSLVQWIFDKYIYSRRNKYFPIEIYFNSALVFHFCI